MDDMVNRGIAPADLDTPIGQLRSLIGDMEYVPLDPPEAGFGDYAAFSDQQLQSFLTLGADSLSYGAGYAYMSLAAQFAADAIKVTTDDESVDLTIRSKEMRAIADMWFNRGDAAISTADNNYFSIVYPEYERDCLEWPPELSAPEIDWWK